MPVYPCLKCNSPVDPAADRSCRNCKDTKPLQCSRCQKRIPTEEVFQRELLKTKKPIFCLECGVREEVIKCGLCNLSLQRHQGKQVSDFPGAKVYHAHCLNERRKQVDRLSKFQPLMALVGILLGALGGWVQGGAIFAAGGAIVLGLLFFGLITLMHTRMSPR